MSKETKVSPINSFIETNWADHPAVEWVLNNKQIILWIIAGLFAALVIAYRILMHNSFNAEADFFKAQADFNKFEEAALHSNNHLADAAALNSLKELMKSHQELHAKYDGALAQTLLLEGQLPESESFAQATFKRTSNDSIQAYHDYAAASLLIGKQQFQEALSESKKLNIKLNAETGFPYETLYFFNLIRQAVLNQQLGFDKEEIQFWKEARKYLQEKGNPEIINLFRHGQANLNQYIEARLKILEGI